MSIMRIALRIAAVQALKGQTLVLGNILDSAIGSLEVNDDGTFRTDKDAPFITVYTDSASTKDYDIAARSMSVNGATDIVFEAGITGAMTQTDPATDETVLVGIGIPATDTGMEFQLDMVIRQIGDALTDPENEWAEIYRGFISRLLRIDRARTASTEGMRLAAHQLRLTVEILPDPPKGSALAATSALARFFAKAEQLADDDVQTQIAMMKAQLSAGALSWHEPLRRFGLTRPDADAMLVTPVEGAENDIAIGEIAPADSQPTGPST